MRAARITVAKAGNWPPGTALADIYLKPPTAWWRLLNPDWVNPGNVAKKNGGGIDNVYKRLEDASKFLSAIASTFHPLTYASYCAGERQLSWPVDDNYLGRFIT